jgi:hypothetical protein
VSIESSIIFWTRSGDELGWAPLPFLSLRGGGQANLPHGFYIGLGIGAETPSATHGTAALTSKKAAR